MHRRSLSTALAVALTFGSVALTTGVASNAVADDQRDLGIVSFGDIVVDGVHQRVFVSDPVSDRVVITDYRGNFVAEVSGLRGVTGLELSPDSRTVYAAVPDGVGDTGDAIFAIDTVTAKESARYATGDVNPRSVALAGGKLWFGYGAAGTGNIGSVDLTGPEHKVTLEADAAKPWSASPLLDAAPGSGSLVAGLPGLAWSELGVYDVSSGTATATARKTVAGSELRDLAVTADGARIVAAAQDPSDPVVFKTSDLTADGKYAGSPGSANAVAVAPDGTVAAGNDTNFGQGLHIYKPNRTASVRDYDFINGTGTGALATAGLGWAPDRSRLFAITALNGTYELRVLNDPTKAVTSVSVTAPVKSDRAKKLTVNGKVTSKVTLPAGSKVTITRKDLDAPSGRKIGTATVAANGTFSFTNSPPAGGKVTYVLSYAGDADHLASSGSDSVDVSRAATSIRLSNNAKTYDYAKSVKFTAHLGRTYKNRKVEIWADPSGSDRPNKLVKTGTVNRNGDFSTTYKLTRDTRLTARFTGDARYAPKTVASTVYTRVKVSTSISRQYQNKNVYGQTYAYFHQATTPLFTTSMTAYPHRQQRLQIEYFYEGTWFSGGSKDFTLDSAGISRVELGGTHDVGYRFRLRSSYLDGVSGDNVNATTHGAWKYFIFTT
ncbi:YncE family protein [Streptomyces sp. WI04-05B]|uniref:YncE family protein n=1 Tax=Streptomyces TaxID=1883 RepID=UPI0029A89005|nr:MULTISPECIES: Ig-like domain repeat protein [unclassified Streptomyces]MDX2543265.1 Ig-like domain repeat protein [Streptomyces sp. WI04-05B]MDX2584694.1 Ig-like domain repeat protein [Streptomyces sp. WI04-05A]MDX3752799.1 Ig-like domain repeat protein [Streptomyces sp. AK08-02]